MDEEKKDEQVTLKGEIVSISAKFWNDGWGFGELRPSDGKRLKIVGQLEGFRMGMHVSIVGQYVQSEKHGRQLKVETIVMDDPSDMKGVRQWIIDRIPQIGPKRADIIAQRWGDRLWEVIEKTPHDLLEIDGITPDRVDAIIRAWTEHKKDRELYVPYYEIGLTHREAHSAAKAELSAEKLKRDPFALYMEIGGISFARNDYLASKANASRTAPSRLVSAILQVLKEASSDGHIGADEDWIEENAAALAGVNARYIRDGLMMALRDEHVIAGFGLIMLPRYAEAERGIAVKITKLLENIDVEPHPGSRSGAGSADDADQAGRSSDRRTGHREVDDPWELPGSSAESLEGGPVRTNGEGGEADR